MKKRICYDCSSIVIIMFTFFLLLNLNHLNFEFICLNQVKFEWENRILKIIISVWIWSLEFILTNLKNRNSNEFVRD
jgi:hypothetical protein